ncbi:hypothetical protein BD414DRAFT_472090 [Trametes punicea]|nr:hypothetical protein BD414DRAFT_472090 [Trametes punicea]
MSGWRVLIVIVNKSFAPVLCGMPACCYLDWSLPLPSCAFCSGRQSRKKSNKGYRTLRRLGTRRRTYTMYNAAVYKRI